MTYTIFSGFITMLIKNLCLDFSGILDASYSDEWKRQRTTAISILRTLGWGKSSIENKIIRESEAVLEELTKRKGVAFNPVELIGNAVSNIICSLQFGDRFEYGDREFQVNKTRDAWISCKLSVV